MQLFHLPLGRWASSRVMPINAGHLTHFTFRTLYHFIQPNLEEVLNDALDVFEDANLLTRTLSHVVTGTLLSPFELVRTRYTCSQPE